MKRVLCFVTAGLLLFALIGCGGGAKQEESGAGKTYVGVVNISMESEYWASLANGAKLYADYLNSQKADSAEWIVMPGDSAEKQLANVESFINKYGKSGTIFLDPYNTSVTPLIAEQCEEAGVKLVIYATLEEGLYPTDLENFVAYISNDNLRYGYVACKDLFDSMGGKGKVAELYGVPGNLPAELRHQGMAQALKEYPDIELLDSQIANYLGSEAMAVMEAWITKYGDELQGVFCHSDGMAVGAAETLKNKGLVGKIKIVGYDGAKAALDCIKDGSMYSTMFQDGYSIGGYGAAWANAAKNGTLDVKTMDQKKRMFYSAVKLVKTENVDEIYNSYITNPPTAATFGNFQNLDAAIDDIIPNPKL